MVELYRIRMYRSLYIVGVRGDNWGKVPVDRGIRPVSNQAFRSRIVLCNLVRFDEPYAGIAGAKKLSYAGGRRCDRQSCPIPGVYCSRNVG
jgi:hypothetical protein